MRQRLSNLQIGSFVIPSQDPSAVSPADREISLKYWLPAFLAFWQALERETGFRWKCTSYMRDSPSHSRGQAIDFAPDWETPDLERQYAVGHGSDPVLYKRKTLIGKLLRLRDHEFLPRPLVLGVFIEPDHLHVQVLEGGPLDFPTNIVKWGVPKPIYMDTYDRMKLPLFFDGPAVPR